MTNATKNLNVIYAEDDLDVAFSMHKIFKRLFGGVEHFANGQLALDYYLQNKDDIDLVITDITMPIMNGIELVKAIRGVSSNEIPVIAITAHTAEYTDDLSSLHVKVFNKPLDVNQFADVISAWLCSSPHTSCKP